MTTDKKLSFIIIDDSELDCFIAEKMIRHSIPNNGITIFNAAAEALTYIKDSVVAEDETTVLLLDVLMPMMSGFIFVEEFEKLPSKVQNGYFIVALTSSMNKKDIDKICSYSSVRILIDKPITTEALTSLPL